MGISEFLRPVLEDAGRPIDLRDYVHDGILRLGGGTNGKRRRKRRRPLRIGVDVSAWIYRAIHAYGDMLGDERHLTQHGRADLILRQQQHQQQHQQSTSPDPAIVKAYIDTCTKKVLDRLETFRTVTGADVLVVLDGQTPPMKRRATTQRRDKRKEYQQQRDSAVDPTQSPTQTNAQRTRAFKRAGASRDHFTTIIDQLQGGMRQLQLSFLVAPYEADSQLAYLSNNGYLDLVVTEDSDLIAHGAEAIVYKCDDDAKGVLLQFIDIGASRRGGTTLHLVDFTPVMMAVLFVAAGSDYMEKLKGIGVITASKIVRKAFLEPRSDDVSPLEIVLELLFHHSYDSNLSIKVREEYEENFLSALVMYRHAIAYDPTEGKCVFSGGGCSSTTSSSSSETLGDFELIEYEPYAALLKDMDRVQNIVGTLPNEMDATDIAEGRKSLRKKKKMTTTTTTTSTDANNTTSTICTMAKEDAAAAAKAANANATNDNKTTTNDDDDDDEDETTIADTNVQARNGKATQSVAEESSEATDVQGESQPPPPPPPPHQNGYQIRTRQRRAQHQQHQFVVANNDTNTNNNNGGGISNGGNGGTPNRSHHITRHHRNTRHKHPPEQPDDSDATVQMNSPEPQSPNLLLLSSSIEKTVGSRSSSTITTTKRSPNLLCSSTPEPSTGPSQFSNTSQLSTQSQQ